MINITLDRTVEVDSNGEPTKEHNFNKVRIFGITVYRNTYKYDCKYAKSTSDKQIKGFQISK